MFSVKKNVLETVALIKAYGIDQIVLCPGSRNAPLIQTFTSDSFFKCHIVVDERNAAFYALGIIQNIKKPVVVCCTSGSALLNFAPAVSEAFYQKLPLIVISGDRGQEWIGQMDGQTIPQLEAFGSLSKKTIQLPEIKNDTDLWYCNRLINEALIISESENAPIHINVPISEPLFDYSIQELPQVRKFKHPRTLKSIEIKHYVQRLSLNPKIVIVVGQNVFNSSLTKVLESFVQKLNAVVIVEHQSNSNSELFISNADTILSITNNAIKKSLVPDILISIEGHILSKKLKQFFRQNKPKEHWLVTENLEVIDVFQSLTDILETDVNRFLEDLINSVITQTDKSFLNSWKYFSNKIKEPQNINFSDLSVMGDFIQNIPDDVYLHLANSSVIRNAQYYNLKKSIEVFCNRGTNGIESSLPSAIGTASTTDKLVFLVIGDLSFFYTVGALWNIKHIKNLRILLINNTGGAIFHSLPGLDSSTSLKQYVAAGHNSNAEKWVDAAGFKYLSATNDSELKKAFASFFSKDVDQSIMLEVFTDIDKSKEVVQEYNNKLKNNI